MSCRNSHYSKLSSVVLTCATHPWSVQPQDDDELYLDINHRNYTQFRNKPNIFVTEVKQSVVISAMLTLPFKYVRARLAASRSILGYLFPTSLLSIVSLCKIKFLLFPLVYMYKILYIFLVSRIAHHQIL